MDTPFVKRRTLNYKRSIADLKMILDTLSSLRRFDGTREIPYLDFDICFPFVRYDSNDVMYFYTLSHSPHHVICKNHFMLELWAEDDNERWIVLRIKVNEGLQGLFKTEAYLRGHQQKHPIAYSVFKDTIDPFLTGVLQDRQTLMLEVGVTVGRKFHNEAAKCLHQHLSPLLLVSTSSRRLEAVLDVSLKCPRGNPGHGGATAAATTEFSFVRNTKYQGDRTHNSRRLFGAAANNLVKVNHVEGGVQPP